MSFGFVDSSWDSLSWTGYHRRYFPQATQYPVGGHWAAQQIDGTAPINDDDVLTVAELKERTHLEESDELLQSYISAARAQVEHDTGLALPQQIVTVGYDRIEPTGIYRIPLPPTQAVTSIAFTDTDGTVTPLVDAIQLDTLSCPARFTWLPTVLEALGTPIPMGALLLTVTAGYPAGAIPPLLKFAVGLLASHYCTNGRDLVNIERGNPMQIPMGYEAAIQAYRLEVLV